MNTGTVLSQHKHHLPCRTASKINQHVEVRNHLFMSKHDWKLWAEGRERPVLLRSPGGQRREAGHEEVQTSD